MAKSQRTKGAAGEREFCKLLAEHGFPDPKRLLGQARDGGGDVPTPPILWEVKRRQRVAVYDFMRQCVDAIPNRKEGDCHLPAVALRADGEDWLVVMRAADLLPLLKTLVGGERANQS